MAGTYVNGSDLLLFLGNKCMGHCTSHSISLSAEQRSHAVKPVQSRAQTGTGLWKGKTIGTLNCQIQGEGMVFAGETEKSYYALMSAFASAEPIAVKCFQRGHSETECYLKGNFIITSLEQSAPADDDATWSITLENSGEVTFDSSKNYMAPGVSNSGDDANGASLTYPESATATDQTGSVENGGSQSQADNDGE